MEQSKILIVDDESNMRTLLSYILKSELYQLETASNGAECLAKCHSQKFDIILQDMMLPDMEGIELLNQFKTLQVQTIVIVITATDSWQIAVEAMRLGAFDYIRKPFENEQVKAAVTRAIKYKEMRKTIPVAGHNEGLENIIGSSPYMQKVQDIIRRVAPTDSTVLIQGESGTGKELVARAVHRNSLRRETVFIPVNCGAFSETLMESELFGHLKGSFTGAIRDKKGLFEVADNGTLFFDEIGEMLPSTQVKLLRVLEYREFMPVGSTKPKAVDIRFIAATNQNLEKQIEKNAFREDLYYRLNVIPIYLPPLRERKEDIPLLAGYFLALYADRMHKYVIKFSDDAMKLLLNYHWPGNIRELSNLIQRAVVMCEDSTIQRKDLEHHIPDTRLKKNESDITLPENGLNLETYIENIEKILIKKALQKSKWNITNAALLLKMSFRSLRYKISKYKIPQDESSENV